GWRRSAAREQGNLGLEVRRLDGATHRLAVGERADLAEAALRGMSLTRDFARIVLMVGHGSTSTNNLHASGLDCGACGGHAGDANARLAATLLNDPAVRGDLSARGIEIPADTIFLAALHDTTSDEVRILDRSPCAPTHEAELLQLQEQLAFAGDRTRRERARRFGIDPEESFETRGRDWSQIRPEWGLAGCSAFIVAPRSRSRQADLGGRSFLHSYDWRGDRDFVILEQIMTAPMIVASWINLQYYGSTVDNRVFGCGDKTLHNAVGSIGVLEGNGGDLRVGLPWQSLHDGERYLHEPLRLEVVIEAPLAAIDTVIARHQELQKLFDGDWLNLLAIDEMGAMHRYRGAARWKPLEPVPSEAEQLAQEDAA
ncbi:MAG: DUF2309 family protein, partial [Planctomycetes bacterium]|nr:DUF2309 family protein [Planctomycetota bacterium]